ncbi:hypothetical protein [Yinghuangia soli]|uniref:ATP-binding protein n=1 Tax=Yinghuangia soli TaxID=2908204 RepID=A0AA41Q2C3_9ACTN|nr:hypothetical protein [Yinghuangia soli]MCF2530288.1 hypothetical protein [Yinghuangia soli]
MTTTKRVLACAALAAASSVIALSGSAQAAGTSLPGVPGADSLGQVTGLLGGAGLAGLGGGVAPLGGGLPIG